MLAGSASNWIDRAARGVVLVYLPGFGGRGFNLADVAIVVGTLLAAILLVVRLAMWITTRTARSART